MKVTELPLVSYSLETVVLEKRETRQISFFVRGLKAGGPVDSSNLVNERVNYDEVTSVDLAGTPQGFQISVLTDRIEVKFFVHEDWRAQDAVDSLDAKLISSIDTERLGLLDRIQGATHQAVNTGF